MEDFYFLAIGEMKRTVVIMSDYVDIGKEADRLKILLKDKKSTLPLTNVDGILIYGKATISSDAISLCAKNCIPLIFLSKMGNIKALIVGPDLSSGRNRRLKQASLYFKKRLEVAKYIVKKKILEIEYVFDLELENLKRATDAVSDFSRLLGIEGVASRQMYTALNELIAGSDFVFTERSYNPPKDEVNAVLSYVYTLGYNLALGLITLQGFDPYISFLHAKRGEHASFASDLVEVIRPHLTYLVGELIKEKKLLKTHFDKEKETFYLKKTALNTILERIASERDNLIALLKELLLEIENFP